MDTALIASEEEYLSAFIRLACEMPPNALRLLKRPFATDDCNDMSSEVIIEDFFFANH